MRYIVQLHSAHIENIQVRNIDFHKDHVEEVPYESKTIKSPELFDTNDSTLYNKTHNTINTFQENTNSAYVPFFEVYKKLVEEDETLLSEFFEAYKDTIEDVILKEQVIINLFKYASKDNYEVLTEDDLKKINEEVNIGSLFRLYDDDLEYKMKDKHLALNITKDKHIKGIFLRISTGGVRPFYKVTRNGLYDLPKCFNKKFDYRYFEILTGLFVLYHYDNPSFSGRDMDRYNNVLSVYEDKINKSKIILSEFKNNSRVYIRSAIACANSIIDFFERDANNRVNINSTDYEIYHSALNSDFKIPQFSALHISYSDPSDIIFYKKAYKNMSMDDYKKCIKNKEIINISLKGLYGKKYNTMRVSEETVDINGNLVLNLDENNRIIKIQNFQVKADGKYLYDTENTSTLEFRFMDDGSTIESKIQNRNYQCGKATQFFARNNENSSGILLDRVKHFFKKIGVYTSIKQKSDIQSNLDWEAPDDERTTTLVYYRTSNPINIKDVPEIKELILYALKLKGFEHYITFETK